MPSLAILVSVVLILSRGQTDRRDRITEADQRGGVSNKTSQNVLQTAELLLAV